MYHTYVIQIALSAVLFGLPVGPADQFVAERESMVRNQIERRGVKNLAVLRAMRHVPRHLFVPQPMQPSAYEDRPLPIGYGQTISQPYIVALMTELLEPDKGHKTLEVGTGSGYQAAVLSELVQRVYTIEIVGELAQSSADTLKKLGHKNVTVRQGDGYQGWPGEAPFDRIIITAAPPEVPQALLDQLKPGGKLVAPVGESPLNQELIVIDKSVDGRLSRRSVAPVMFVPMVHGQAAAHP